MSFSHFLTFSILLYIFASCNPSAGIDVREAMTKYTGEAITDTLPDINRAVEYDDSLKLGHYDGFYSRVEDDAKGHVFVEKHRKAYKEKGYLLFVFNDNDYNAFLGAMKSGDELDIVRWRGTDGINYGHTNGDVVRKLQEWSAGNPIGIYSISFDLVEFYFENPVKDADTFANEVYEFCPDAVDQGVGSIEALRKAIESMNGVYLWWD